MAPSLSQRLAELKLETHCARSQSDEIIRGIRRPGCPRRRRKTIGIAAHRQHMHNYHCTAKERAHNLLIRLDREELCTARATYVCTHTWRNVTNRSIKRNTRANNMDGRRREKDGWIISWQNSVFQRRGCTFACGEGPASAWLCNIALEVLPSAPPVWEKTTYEFSLAVVLVSNGSCKNKALFIFQ